MAAMNAPCFFWRQTGLEEVKNVAPNRQKIFNNLTSIEDRREDRKTLKTDYDAKLLWDDDDDELPRLCDSHYISIISITM